MEVVAILSALWGGLAGALLMRRYLTGRFLGPAPDQKKPPEPPSGAA